MSVNLDVDLSSFQSLTACQRASTPRLFASNWLSVKVPGCQKLYKWRL